MAMIASVVGNDARIGGQAPWSTGRRLCIGVAAIGVLLTSCGGGHEQSRLNANKPAPPTGGGPAVSAPGTSTARPGPAPTELATLPSRENTANRATPLGRLCWVEHEVGRAAADLFSTVLLPGFASKYGGTEPSPSVVSAVIRQVKTRMAATPAALGSAAGLPPSLVPFHDRLARGLVEAGAVIAGLPDDAPLPRRREAVDALTGAINMEVFPGAQEFADAARADPRSCPAGA